MIIEALRKHYVSEIEARGIDADNIVRASLEIKIDWWTLQIAINTGGDIVNIPTDWVGGVNPDLTDLIDAYLEYFIGRSLTRGWRWDYNRVFRLDAILEDLGIVDDANPPPPPRYSDALEGIMVNNPYLPGVSHRLRVDTTY